MKTPITRQSAMAGPVDRSGEDAGRFAVPLLRLNSLFVEAHKGFGTKPSAFMRNNPVGKVTPGIQKCETRFHGLHINLRALARNQRPNRRSNPFVASVIAFEHHPHELAQGRKRQRDQIGSRQCLAGNGRLYLLILCGVLKKNIGICGDLHGSPTQPVDAISLISSIDSGFRPSCFSMPNASAILPVGLTARILTSPPGSVSMVTFSPGLMPRCLSNSFRKVICPLAETVIAFIQQILSSARARANRLTFKGEAA